MRAASRLVAVVAAACAWLAVVPARAESTLDLGAFKGRVVYLDFWASWCAPCRRSFPWMEAMKQAYGPKGLTVVAVDVDTDRDAAQRFLDRFNPSFQVRFDPSGALAAQYKVEGMPTSFLIDRHGVVRSVHMGFRPGDRQALERQLQNLLAEK